MRVKLTIDTENLTGSDLKLLSAIAGYDLQATPKAETKHAPVTEAESVPAAPKAESVPAAPKAPAKRAAKKVDPSLVPDDIMVVNASAAPIIEKAISESKPVETLFAEAQAKVDATVVAALPKIQDEIGPSHPQSQPVDEEVAAIGIKIEDIKLDKEGFQNWAMAVVAEHANGRNILKEGLTSKFGFYQFNKFTTPEERKEAAIAIKIAFGQDA